MKIGNFVGKGNIFGIFHRVRKFVENRGKSETGGKCIMAIGGDGRPWPNFSFRFGARSKSGKVKPGK